MKYSAFLLLLLFQQFAYPQNVFTKFVSDKNIQWAISAEQNISCDSFNLNLYLRQQLDQNKIKAAIIDDFETLQSIQFVDKDSVGRRIDPYMKNGDSIKNPFFNETYFDAEVKNQVEAYQILYVEKGKIKSVVNTVSPKQAVVTKSNTRLGVTNAFSTAFNFSRSLKKKIINNSKVVAVSSLNITAFDERNKIQKSVYNKGLLSAIWSSIGKDYKIMRLDSMNYISRQEFMEAAFHHTTRVHIPVYDVNGNITHTKIIAPVIEPGYFSRVTVEQEWYYNESRHIFFNRIASVMLYMKLADDTEVPAIFLIPK